MINRIYLCQFFFFLIVIMLNNFCTKDKGIPIMKTGSQTCKSRYVADIKPIIMIKCATDGCHESNFPFGNFTSYSELKIRIDNGRIRTLVFENDLMPPANSVKLSTDELEILKCWIDDGAIEN